MNRDELAAAYTRLRDYLANEQDVRRMAGLDRLPVVQALADLRLLGQFVGLELENRGPEMDRPAQPALIDVPVKRRGY